MSMNSFRIPPATEGTSLAAMACLAKLKAVSSLHKITSLSPLEAVSLYFDSLTEDIDSRQPAWTVRAALPSEVIDYAHDCLNFDSFSPSDSGWKAWFAHEESFEKPFLYFSTASSIEKLSTLLNELGERGILFNDMERHRHWLPKGVKPTVPIWLASNLDLTPYDPATGYEAQVIVEQSLHQLYIGKKPGFIYQALHDDNWPKLHQIPLARSEDIINGMYKVYPSVSLSTSKRISLLGAGSILKNVLETSKILWNDWGITSDIWSCPSYTKLARDAAQLKQLQMMCSDEQHETSHLERCLGSINNPVLAVSGYQQLIPQQISQFIKSKFSAFGADTIPNRSAGETFPLTKWLVYFSLKLLADDGRIPNSILSAALYKYELA